MAKDAGTLTMTVDVKAEIPVHLQSYKELFKAVPKRLIGLVSKAIGFKALIFAIGTFLLAKNLIDQWVWLVLAGTVIFGREILKYLPNITGRK